MMETQNLHVEESAIIVYFFSSDDSVISAGKEDSVNHYF